MDLTKIMAISGKGGLFQMVAETRNGLIVESLIDGKRLPVYSSYKVSSLEEISVFTNGEDALLKDVFKAIHDKENGGPAIDHKSSNNEIKGYFGEAFSDYDEDRVYVSDMKKMIQWYNILQAKGLITFEEEEAENEEAAPEAEKADETPSSEE